MYFETQAQNIIIKKEEKEKTNSTGAPALQNGTQFGIIVTSQQETTYRNVFFIISVNNKFAFIHCYRPDLVSNLFELYHNTQMITF